MGNCHGGSSKKSRRRTTEQTALDLKLMAALKDHGKSSLKSLNSLLMKFSSIGEGFRDCRNAFDDFDENKNGTIERNELKEVMKNISGISDVPTDEIFANADINGDEAISFKEFIVALTLAYFAKGKGGKSDLKLGRFEQSIEIAIDAFTFFDSDQDGLLQKNEVLSTFNEATSSARNKSIPATSKKRFEEMDWDEDGTISFPEFLFALTGWAGIEDDGEEL